jgi:transposase-like protein
MPPKYQPEVRRQVLQLAGAGSKPKDLAEAFGMSTATIYNWLRQQRIDSGEENGTSTDQAVQLKAAQKRIKQLETELAVSRKVNEVFLSEGIPPKGSSR